LTVFAAISNTDGLDISKWFVKRTVKYGWKNRFVEYISAYWGINGKSKI
jgi:hypothetical protein